MIIKQKIQKTDGTIQFRNYLKKERLGSGGFAECFLVQRTEDKKQYALKIIPKKLLSKSKARQKMISEIKLHRRAKHRNICQLQRAFQDDQNVYMLLELCRNKNMFELIKRRKRLTVPETQYFITQLIDALCYLHNRNTIHRDVKLGNLLINEDRVLKLADFGLAAKIQFNGDRKHTVCGTPNYIAPEIIKSSMGLGHSGHSYEVDVWSTGVIMYIMLIGRAPFETVKVQRTYQRISKGQFGFPETFKNESAKDLLRRVLVVDPSKRYTFQQFLAHPFMNPKNGIPKQLPPSSMISAPKFGVFEKYAQDQVKQSARNASINTIRSSLDASMNDEFNNSDVETDRSSKSKSRVKGLLRNVLSASSLSKSLEKLSSLGKNYQTSSFKHLGSSQISNSSQVSQPYTSSLSNSINNSGINNSSLMNQFSINNMSVSTTTIHKNRLMQEKTQNINSPNTIYKQTPQKKKLEPKYVYILDFKNEIVLSYILNNGYIGTFQAKKNKYKLFYNRTDKIYFQIVGTGEIKKYKEQTASVNENISNRKKILDQFISLNIPCAPYNPFQQIIYLNKAIEIKNQNLFLFKFSNNDIQAFNHKTGLSLLITEKLLIHSQITEGHQTKQTIVQKDELSKASTSLVEMYYLVKRILYKISNLGKQ